MEGAVEREVVGLVVMVVVTKVVMTRLALEVRLVDAEEDVDCEEVFDGPNVIDGEEMEGKV